MDAVPLLSLVGVRHGAPRGTGRVEGLLVGVSLDIGAGELVAVVGSRSQGKTTLLQLAAGLVAPEDGVVCFCGQDLAGLPERGYARLLREEIGLVGQSGPRVDLRMVHYVAAPLLVSRKRKHRRQAFARAATALERVGMVSRARQRWGDLSRWDRALVEVAQGIVREPALLLVDDVTDGLGMRETAEVTKLLRSLAEDMGMGVLVTVSDGEAALSAHRVFSLSRGRLRAISDQSPRPANVIDLPAVRGGSNARRDLCL
jgi:predicted ABC-type transport system involved in lysophospholipase L1 biosynthesis ATPase subunit